VLNRLMKPSKHLLTACLLYTLAACSTTEKAPLASAGEVPSERYGLDTVKLGDSRSAAGKQIEALLIQPLQCHPSSAATHSVTVEECNAVPAQGAVGKLWGEQLTAFKATFVENQLCGLQMQLQTSGNKQALYDAHGMHILNLFGKPDETSDQQAMWQRQGDQATMQDLGQGKFSIDIRRAAVMQDLQRAGG